MFFSRKSKKYPSIGPTQEAHAPSSSRTPRSRSVFFSKIKSSFSRTKMVGDAGDLSPIPDLPRSSLMCPGLPYSSFTRPDLRKDAMLSNDDHSNSPFQEEVSNEEETIQSSEASPSKLYPVIFPEDDPEPQLVFVAQSSPYWTGRFTSLRDRLQNRTHQAQLSWIFNLPPEEYELVFEESVRGVTTDREVLHREMRVFAALEVQCVNAEAKASLLSWQRAFAIKFNKPELMPSARSAAAGMALPPAIKPTRQSSAPTRPLSQHPPAAATGPGLRKMSTLAEQVNYDDGNSTPVTYDASDGTRSSRLPVRTQRFASGPVSSTKLEKDDRYISPQRKTSIPLRPLPARDEVTRRGTTLGATRDTSRLRPLVLPQQNPREPPFDYLRSRSGEKKNVSRPSLPRHTTVANLADVSDMSSLGLARGSSNIVEGKRPVRARVPRQRTLPTLVENNGVSSSTVRPSRPSNDLDGVSSEKSNTGVRSSRPSISNTVRPRRTSSPRDQTVRNAASLAAVAVKNAHAENKRLTRFHIRLPTPAAETPAAKIPTAKHGGQQPMLGEKVINGAEPMGLQTPRDTGTQPMSAEKVINRAEPMGPQTPRETGVQKLEKPRFCLQYSNPLRDFTRAAVESGDVTNYINTHPPPTARFRDLNTDLLPPMAKLDTEVEARSRIPTIKKEASTLPLQPVPTVRDDEPHVTSAAYLQHVKREPEVQSGQGVTNEQLDASNATPSQPELFRFRNPFPKLLNPGSYPRDAPTLEQHGSPRGHDVDEESKPLIRPREDESWLKQRDLSGAQHVIARPKEQRNLSEAQDGSPRVKGPREFLGTQYVSPRVKEQRDLSGAQHVTPRAKEQRDISGAQHVTPRAKEQRNISGAQYTSPRVEKQRDLSGAQHTSPRVEEMRDLLGTQHVSPRGQEQRYFGAQNVSSHLKEQREWSGTQLVSPREMEQRDLPGTHQHFSPHSNNYPDNFKSRLEASRNAPVQEQRDLVGSTRPDDNTDYHLEAPRDPRSDSLITHGRGQQDQVSTAAPRDYSGSQSQARPKGPRDEPSRDLHLPKQRRGSTKNQESKENWHSGLEDASDRDDLPAPHDLSKDQKASPRPTYHGAERPSFSN